MQTRSPTWEELYKGKKCKSFHPSRCFKHGQYMQCSVCTGILSSVYFCKFLNSFPQVFLYEALGSMPCSTYVLTQRCQWNKGKHRIHSAKSRKFSVDSLSVFVQCMPMWNGTLPCVLFCFQSGAPERTAVWRRRGRGNLGLRRRWTGGSRGLSERYAVFTTLYVYW